MDEFNAYAKANRFDKAVFIISYNDHDIYQLCFNNCRTTGLPVLITKTDGQVRFLSDEETWEVIRFVSKNE